MPYDLATDGYRYHDLYTSAQLHADALIFDDTAPVCISFTPAGSPRMPFGRDFALKHRLNWIAVTCDDNAWFQYADLAQAEAAIAAFVAKFPRVICYGGSQGGFGALYCSRAVGAHAVLAFAPQTFMGTQHPHGERRWNMEWSYIAARTGEHYVDLKGRVSLTAELYIFDDPQFIDRVHTKELLKIRDAHLLLVPMSGHHPLNAIVQLGLSTEIIRSVMQGPLDVTVLQSRIDFHRRGSLQALSIFQKAVLRKRPLPVFVLERVLPLLSKLSPSWWRRAAHYSAKNNYRDCLVAVLKNLLADEAYSGSLEFLADMKEFSRSLTGMTEICLGFVGRLRDIADNRASQFNWHPDLQDTVLWPIFLAQSYWSEAAGDRHGALSSAREAALSASAWGAANGELAIAFAALGDETSADMFLNRIRYRSSEDFECHRSLARNAERRLDWGLVVQIWQEAMELGVDPLRASCPMARALLKLSRPTEALEVLGCSLTVAVPATEAVRLQVECLLRLQRTDEALDVLRSLIERDGNDPQPRYMLYDANMTLNRYAEALEVARQTLKLHPGDAKALRQVDRASAKIK